ncbi:MAG: hypothetical protein WBE13_01640 [Candidatus Acidiferrum sp.]
MTTNFIFVGYLIQEPFWRRWPGREGYRVASIEREWHPKFNKYQWSKIDGVDNPTRFLTELPDLDRLPLEPHDCKSQMHKQSPGWVVSGYAFPQDVIEQRTMVSTDGKQKLLEFGYAPKLQRAADGLKLLGYEVLDADDIFLSILNDCGYTVEQVREMAGPLNEYSLLPSLAEAERFKEAIKIDPLNPRVIPDHNQGIIVEVRGQT